MRFDGGWLLSKLGFSKSVELFSPFRQPRAANAIDWRPVVCGLLSFILFLVAADTSKLLS